MRYHHLLSVLSILAAARPLGDPAIRLAPRWDDKRVKHAWDAVPVAWESLGPPPAGITIDLSIALKPHDENGLIDALYKVSSPGHPRHVLSDIPLRTHLLKCAAALLQIWCTSVKGAGR